MIRRIQVLVQPHPRGADRLVELESLTVGNSIFEQAAESSAWPWIDLWENLRQ